ncbi:alpha/beta hydrolase [Actinoplanes sp. NPDC051851]|uniref:alpha/beta hydrolase n=1 Tax=Actinoplanes sp. NPDC051851 TaxID=3154753 RepID=UPI00343874DC
MKRFWAAATAVALCAVGAAVTSAEAGTKRGGPDYVPPPVTWSPCADPALKAQGVECGTVTVPRDYANPKGVKLQLAVSRVKHAVSAEKYQGVILVNPGGPGGAGRPMATIGSHVPRGAGLAYDWIGFDPRGVGASKPRLSCQKDYAGYNRPPYVPTTPAIEKAWHARTTEYAAKCAKAGGPLLDHLRTEDTVRDMESIRRALGAPQINFYGFSYGTYLGQVYATMFPDRVRRMVLDGNVNPSRVWYQSNIDQDIAFDRNIKIYFGWIAKRDAVYHLGTTAAQVEQAYYKQLAELATKPAGGSIGPAELTDIFLQPGYYIFNWEEVARAFADWVVDHKPEGLKRLYDENNAKTPEGDNSYAIYLAVQCTDAPWPSEWSKWAEDNWRVYEKSPFETWGNAWYNAPCRHWAAPPGTPIRVDGAKAPPILLLSETLDAATPFSGSLEVRRRFPKAALIEGVNGTTHAGSLFGNACVDDAVADYLATGALPKRAAGDESDKKCDPLAQPGLGAPLAQRAPVLLERLHLQEMITGRG